MDAVARSARQGADSATTTCENGHVNPANQHFCGDCGRAIEPTAAICVHGHVSPKNQRFCGECGVPVRAPARTATAAPGARWNVDPSGRHEYRYWDGGAWSAKVADSGTVSTDPFPGGRSWHPETLLGVAAGVATVILLIGAIAGIAMELPGRAESTTTVAQTTPATSTAEAAVAPPTEPAPLPAIRPAAVIGAPCRANSSTGLTADGSTSYCERLAATDAYLWSLYPGDIPSPDGGLDPGQGNPAVAVCMAQTERSAPECVDYLQGPSDPGDGPPSA